MFPVILLFSLIPFTHGFEIYSVGEPGEDVSKNLAVGGIKFETEPLRSDYNQEEMELIRSLNDIARSSRRGLFDFHDWNPRCHAANMSAICCITIKAAKKTYDTCVEAGFNLFDLKAYAGLSFNHHPVIMKELLVGKLCWGLPRPFSKISACLWVYHFELRPKRREFEICTLVELTPVFHVSFNCLRFENGTFSTHELIRTEERGIINVQIVGGKLKFEIERLSIGKSIKEWITKRINGIRNIFGRKKSTN